MARILLDPSHLLLSALSLTPQKESLPHLLPLAILSVTILLFTTLLFTTFLHLSYPLFLFPYLLKLSPVLFTPTNSYNTPSYFPFSSSSFPQSGPIVFPGSPPDYPYFRTTFSGSNSIFSNTAPPPSYPSGFQSTSGPSPFRGRGRNSRGTHSGRRRAPRGKRYRITSSTSCQTSPIPSYLWPDYQPSLISSGDASANNALNLALMPRVFNHCPPSLPLNPLQYDFFTVLRATSPVVSFHCPSPLTQRSFSFVYSLSFTRGLGSKSLLIAGINQ